MRKVKKFINKMDVPPFKKKLLVIADNSSQEPLSRTKIFSTADQAYKKTLDALYFFSEQTPKQHNK